MLAEMNTVVTTAVDNRISKQTPSVKKPKTAGQSMAIEKQKAKSCMVESYLVANPVAMDIGKFVNNVNNDAKRQEFNKVAAANANYRLQPYDAKYDSEAYVQEVIKKDTGHVVALKTQNAAVKHKQAFASKAQTIFEKDKSEMFWNKVELPGKPKIVDIGLTVDRPSKPAFDLTDIVDDPDMMERVMKQISKLKTNQEKAGQVKAVRSMIDRSKALAEANKDNDHHDSIDDHRVSRIDDVSSDDDQTNQKCEKHVAREDFFDDAAANLQAGVFVVEDVDAGQQSAPMKVAKVAGKPVDDKSKPQQLWSFDDVVMPGKEPEIIEQPTAVDLNKKSESKPVSRPAESKPVSRPAESKAVSRPSESKPASLETKIPKTSAKLSNDDRQIKPTTTDEKEEAHNDVDFEDENEFIDNKADIEGQDLIDDDSLQEKGLADAVEGHFESVKLEQERKLAEKKENGLKIEREKRMKAEQEKMKIEKERLKIEQERINIEQEKMRVERERFEQEKKDLSAKLAQKLNISPETVLSAVTTLHQLSKVEIPQSTTLTKEVELLEISQPPANPKEISEHSYEDDPDINSEIDPNFLKDYEFQYPCEPSFVSQLKPDSPLDPPVSLQSPEPSNLVPVVDETQAKMQAMAEGRLEVSRKFDPKTKAIEDKLKLFKAEEAAIKQAMEKQKIDHEEAIKNREKMIYQSGALGDSRGAKERIQLSCQRIEAIKSKVAADDIHRSIAVNTVQDRIAARFKHKEDSSPSAGLGDLDNARKRMESMLNRAEQNFNANWKPQEKEVEPQPSLPTTAEVMQTFKKAVDQKKPTAKPTETSMKPSLKQQAIKEPTKIGSKEQELPMSEETRMLIRDRLLRQKDKQEDACRHPWMDFD